MRSLNFSVLRVTALACVAAGAASLVACGSSYDPSYVKRPRFATSSGPLLNAKKDPSFLAYAVPESDLHLFPATRSAEFAVHGIDVSKYQGDIDWEQVRDSGVAFAFIKATEGGDKTDAKFQYNWAAAKAAGVPRGAYHFVYWCRQPQEEIQNFASVVPVEPDALPPVLDVEPTGWTDASFDVVDAYLRLIATARDLPPQVSIFNIGSGAARANFRFLAEPLIAPTVAGAHDAYEILIGFTEGAADTSGEQPVRKKKKRRR